jgi:hypothetical protein
VEQVILALKEQLDQQVHKGRKARQDILVHKVL